MNRVTPIVDREARAVTVPAGEYYRLVVEAARGRYLERTAPGRSEMDDRRDATRWRALQESPYVAEILETFVRWYAAAAAKEAAVSLSEELSGQSPYPTWAELQRRRERVSYPCQGGCGNDVGYGLPLRPDFDAARVMCRWCLEVSTRHAARAERAVEDTARRSKLYGLGELDRAA